MFKVLPIFISFTANRYILPIILIVNISTVFAEPICVPSLEKADTFIPRQSVGELSDGSLECGEFRFQYFNDSEFISRPLSRYWIEADKLSQNSGAELFAGIQTPSLFLPPVSESVSGKKGKKNANEGYQCDGYCAIYLTLPLWIMAYTTALGFGSTT